MTTRLLTPDEKVFLNDFAETISNPDMMIEVAYNGLVQAIYIEGEITQERLEKVICNYDNAFILTGLNPATAKSVYDKKVLELKKKHPDDIYYEWGFNKKLVRFATKELVKAVRLLRLDLDFKDFIKDFLTFSAEAKLKFANDFVEKHNLLKHPKLNDIWAIVFSGNGLHFYFRLSEWCEISSEEYKTFYENFTKMLEKECFNNEVNFDKSLKNIAQTLRLPLSTNAKKDQPEPVDGKLFLHNPEAYSDKNFWKAYVTKEKSPTKRKKSSPPLVFDDNQTVTKKMSQDQTTFEKRFKSWCNQVSCKEGERNNNALRIVREGLGLGLDDQVIYDELKNYQSRGNTACHSLFGDNEIDSIFKSQKCKHEQEPFKSVFINPDVELFSPQQIARVFTAYQNTRFVYTQGKLFYYRNMKYQPIKDAELYNKVLLLLIDHYPDQVQTHKAKTIQHCIKALADSPDNMDFDNWLEPAPSSSKRFLTVQNGIIDIDHFLQSGSVLLHPHTDKYFTTNALPVTYVSSSACPKFKLFLNQVLPDQDSRKLLQQFIGDILVKDSIFEWFIIFVGMGSNGKSVLLFILELIFGKDSCSSASLSDFDTCKNPFGLIKTLGKMLNTCPELSNTASAVEETLKKYVSRESMSFQDKGEPVFYARPTAKLIFSANELPKFRDSTNGFWRRTYFIPFTQSFTGTQKNPQLKTKEYWQEELSGILNWALEGVQELYRTGTPHISKVSEQLLQDRFYISNPAIEFLDTYYEKTDPSYTVFPSEIYSHYKNHCENEGIFPPSKKDLTTIICSHFSTSTLSNPQSRAPINLEGKERKIKGVKLKNGTHGTLSTIPNKNSKEDKKDQEGASNDSIL